MADHHLNALPKGYRLQEYELVRVLGHGGFSITYLGYDHYRGSRGKAVVVKEYLPVDLAGRTAHRNEAPQTEAHRADFARGLVRFLDEARTLERCEHPNIIQVHRFFKAHDTAYIVMDYVKGATLENRLERQGTLDEVELKAILLPLLDGLAQAHAAGVLHRDIRPGNIMLRETDGSPVLVGFGAARQATSAHNRSMAALTTSGYAPLEQYSARNRRQGPWTDLYALSGVCYRALTGNAPEEATERVRDDPQTPAVEAARDEAAPAFLQAIDWALRINENDRPQNAAAWRAALLGEKEAPAVVAGQPSPAADATSPAAKYPTSLLVGGGFALFFFIAALLSLAGGATEGAAIIALFGVAALLVAVAVTTSPDSAAPTALFSALSKRDAAAKTIQALIARGAHVNVTDEHGATPLHKAAKNSTNPEIIRALLTAGAGVNARDEHGATPLHKAAENSLNPEIIEALLAGGAYANARDEHGATPLHWAAGDNENPEIIKALLDGGANVNARDDDQETPLDWARQQEDRVATGILDAWPAAPAAPAHNMADDHINALPQGHRLQEYELVRVLGHGGFGITYLGYDHNLNQAVAVKEYLPPNLAGRPADHVVAPQAEAYRADFARGLERFLDEARALAQLKHPNIIKVHRFFEAHDTAYIVMEYVKGTTLEDKLERRDTLGEDELKAILLPLLDGLAQAHAAGVLHQDIKPANIILRKARGAPVLAGFGSARQPTGARNRPATTIITPGYAPLEQYSSRGRQGPWTDLYALGGVCCRALTGNAPAEAAERVRDDPQEPAVEAGRGKAGMPFLRAIDWALQVNQDDRPQDVEAWRAALLAEEESLAEDAVAVAPAQPAPT